MPYYSAESVIAELKSNNALVCEGIDDLGCPSPAPFSPAHEKRGCTKDPSVCKECRTQTCNQWVIVRSDKYIKLAVLAFNFLFLTNPRGGRIPVADSQLSLFIRRNLIDETKLKIC